jgi:hypothetical protein
MKQRTEAVQRRAKGQLQNGTAQPFVLHFFNEHLFYLIQIMNASRIEISLF